MNNNNIRFQRAASQARIAASPRSFVRRFYDVVAAAVLCLLVLLPTPSHALEKRKTAHGKTIVAYYASWQLYDRSALAKPTNLKHSKVTRYNFAFFQTNVNGDIWGTDDYADPISLYGEVNWSWWPGAGGGYCSFILPGQPPTCQGHKYETGLIYQAHTAGVEVYPSIGGWTLSNAFPAMAKDPTARKAFASNCVKLIETYDFDGIDIDWEYPGYADHMGTPEDKQNYNLLLQDIRTALDELGARKGRFYGLTAALPCGPDHLKNIDIGVVSKLLSELNLMTYDFYGAWDKKTGPNAPLYDMEGGIPGFSAHSCVENWKAGGGRPAQINIGLPFYGRSFLDSGRTGLTKFGQANDGSADIVTWQEDEGFPQYFNIARKIRDFKSFRDEQTKTQYAYNNFGFISYDDERSICEKTEYAIDKNLNGYLIWEISGDLMPDLSTPLLDATNKRLNEPNVRCDIAYPTVPVVSLPLTQSPTPLPTIPVTTPKPTEIPATPTMPPVQTVTTSSPTQNATVTNILPKNEDILFGRGTRQHPGNMRLRWIISEYQPAYNQMAEAEKPKISETIVNIVTKSEPISRFFRWNPKTSRWDLLGDKRAKERVNQMLRQNSLAANTEVVAAENTAKADEANGVTLPSPETVPL